MAACSIEQIIERQIHRWDRVAATLGYEPSPWAEWQRQAPTLAEMTHQPVLTISRDLGAGGREVAQDLARELHYEIFGRAIIDHIAQDLNVQRRIVDIRDEKARSFLEVMVDSWIQGRHIDDTDYLRSLTRVIQGVALRGGVIFLGRGANFILGDRAALRIRLSAPREVRIRRVMGYLNIPEAEAAKRVDQSDRERRDFIRHFFRSDIDDIAHVDLVLNTARIDPHACLPVILAALRARGVQIDRPADV